MEFELKNSVIAFFKTKGIEIIDEKPKIIDLIIKDKEKILIEFKSKNGKNINSNRLIEAYGQLLTAKSFYKIDKLWLIVNSMPLFRHFDLFKENGIKIFEFKNDNLVELQENKIKESKKIIDLKIIQFSVSQEEIQMLEFLKPFAKTKTRTKVFKFCLKKTFELYKDLKA